MLLPEQLSVVMLNGAASEFAFAIKPIVRLAFPVLLTVTVWSAVRPWTTFPNGIWWSVVGATESVTAMTGTGVAVPVPDTLMVTVGVEGSSLGMSKLSLNKPAAVGANRTVRVQDPPGEMGLVQLFDTMLNGATGPAIVPTVRSALPLLLTVTIWSAVLPSRTVPKGIRWSVAEPAESVTTMTGTGVAVPVPDRLIVTVPVAVSLLGMSKVSLKGPVAVGANLTVRVQDPPGAMGLVQLFDTMLNGAAGPAIVPTVRSALPMLLIVTVWSEVRPSVIVPNGIRWSVVGATESVTTICGAGAVTVTARVVLAALSPSLVPLLFAERPSA
jgi:hypothetical protein